MSCPYCAETYQPSLSEKRKSADILEVATVNKYGNGACERHVWKLWKDTSDQTRLWLAYGAVEYIHRV